MKVFVDTSVFYAAADKKDQNNRRIKDILIAAEKNGALLYTSNYILDETCTLIKRRNGHAAAVNFLRRFKESRITPLRITDEIEEAAKEIFIKYKDKDFSFTDCTSFALVDNYLLDQILSLDKDFKHYRYKKTPEILP